MIDELDMSCILNSAGIDASLDTPEVTAFCQADRAYVTGLATYQMTFEGMADMSTEEKDLHFDTHIGGSSNNIISWLPEGATVGNRAILGSGIQNSKAVTAPVDGVVAASVSYQGTDAPIYGLVLTTTVAQATTATWASAQLTEIATTNTTKGGVGHLHVTAVTTGAGTDATIKVQDSSNDSVWADLITWTVESTGPSVQRSTVAGTVNEYVRANNSALNAASITYVVSFGTNR